MRKSVGKSKISQNRELLGIYFRFLNETIST